MRISYYVIEIDNSTSFESIVVFFISVNILFLSINLVLKHAEPSISKIFKNNIILISKYLNLNWNIVNKLLFFYPKKRLILNKNFLNCYWFQMDALSSI